MDALLKCPVCGLELVEEERLFRCATGHSFDKASAGYVNLYRPGCQGKVHGDSQEMVAARRRFLELQFFEPLRTALAGWIQDHVRNGAVLLDAGCGEGYYTNAVAPYFGRVVGVDLSKDAVRRAAKKGGGNTFYCVASIFDLPVLDEGVDMISSIFAPYAKEEFYRVLRPGGFVIAVVPGKEHLWGLKQVLYENPYENDESGYTLPGFSLVFQQKLCYHVTLPSSGAIQDLFHMTPYFWKTPRQAAERLGTLESLETPMSFVILAYQKTKPWDKAGIFKGICGDDDREKA